MSTKVQKILFVICSIFICISVTNNTYADQEEKVIHEGHIDESQLISTGGLPEPTTKEINDLLQVTIQSSIQYSTQGSSINNSAMTLEEYVKSQLLLKKSTINISAFNLPSSDLQKVFIAILNNNPELFFVATSYSYYTSGSYTYSIEPMYASYDEQKFNIETRKLLSKIQDDMSDLEKVIFVHDYLAVDIAYDYDNYLKEEKGIGSIPDECHNVEGSIINKVAVCDGYASAFKYYMSQLGIKCNLVIGGNHAWNQVYLNGKWYFVDVTFDDPVWDLLGRVQHDYLLQSADVFKDDYTWDQSKYEYCNDTTYDNKFWKDIDTQFAYNDNLWYYIGTDGYLNAYNFDTFTNTKKGYIGDKWYAWGNHSSYYTGNYGKIEIYDNLIYYSKTDGVYSCDLNGNNSKKYVDGNLAYGYVYGFRIRDKVMRFVLRTSPNASASQEYLYEVKMPVIQNGLTEDNTVVELEGTSYSYTGSSITPNCIVKYNGFTLYKDIDYTISYSNNKNPGTASVIISGIGDYSGSVSATFEITKINQSISVPSTNITKTYKESTFNLLATAKTAMTYTSSNTNVVKVDSTGKVTILSCGIANITITAKSTYNYNAASKIVKITVNRRKLTEKVKLPVYKYTYNGKEKKPTVTVSGLIKNVDYKVSYSNNIKSGKATIKVTGINNYTGTLTKTFVIYPPKEVVTKTTVSKGGFSIYWNPTSCSGYEIKYSNKSNYSSGNKTVNVTPYSKSSRYIYGLLRNKKYYVKVRAYKVIDGRKYYGSFSDVKSIVTK